MVLTRNDISLSWFGGPITVDRFTAGISDEIVRDLGKLMRKRRYERGQTVFSPETIPDEVVVTLSGDIELSDPNEIETGRTAGLGEVFGLTETLAQARFGRNLQAASDCEVSVLGRQDLIEYLKRSPEICFRSLEVFAENLRSARESALAAAGRDS